MWAADHLTVVHGDGENRQMATMFWVRLVSKTAAMTLAAKQRLGEKVQATVTQHSPIDWSAMTKSVSGSRRCRREEAGG